MVLNDKQLEAAMDADFDRLWAAAPGNDKLRTEKRRKFKEDNREEYVCIITAYL